MSTDLTKETYGRFKGGKGTPRVVPHLRLVYSSDNQQVFDEIDREGGGTFVLTILAVSLSILVAAVWLLL